MYRSKRMRMLAGFLALFMLFTLTPPAASVAAGAGAEDDLFLFVDEAEPYEEVLPPAGDDGPDPPRADGIIVKYRAGSLVSLAGEGPPVHLPDGGNLVHLKPGTGQDMAQELQALRSQPAVEYAIPNYILSNQASPNDPRYDEQWSLPRLQAEWGWDTLTDYLGEVEEPRPVTVAVLDTGIDGTHQDLQGRVLAGYNAIAKTAIEAGAMSDDSSNSHGTMVAGIIAANTDNLIGIAGVAGGFPVNLMPVKVLDRNGYGTMMDVVEGILWAVDQGAEVINLSLGARLPDDPVALAEAVDYAVDHGVTVVAAAGNEGRSYAGFYPADLDGVMIAVAYDRTPRYEVASFSNYNSGYVYNTNDAFLLPGVDILTTRRNDEYGTFTGTSAAAPHLSGIAALLYSVAEGTGEYLRIRESLRQGVSSGDPVYVTFHASRSYPTVRMAATRFSEYDPEANAPILRLGLEEMEVLSGEVRVPARVENPPTVDEVAFYYQVHAALGEDPNPEIYLLTLANHADKNRMDYSFAWDTTTLPDGRYNLIAYMYVEGQQYRRLTRRVHVYNEILSGLEISVEKPDGSPAAGAAVTIWHIGEEDGQPVYTDAMEKAWDDLPSEWRVDRSLRTDESGRIIVSGLHVTSGHDYLVAAHGRNPDFYYTQRVTAPDRLHLDATETAEVAIQAADGPMILHNARIYVDTQVGKIPFGRLTYQGQTTLWLQEGNYPLYLVDDAQHYLVSRDISATPGLVYVDMAPDIGAAVPVSFLVGPDDEPDYLGLLIDGVETDDLGTMVGIDLFAPGQELRISPGTYSLVGKAYYQHADNPDRYALTTHYLGRHHLAEGRDLPLGGVVDGQRYTYQYQYPETITTGDALQVSIRVVDHSDNHLLYTGYVDTADVDGRMSGVALDIIDTVMLQPYVNMATVPEVTELRGFCFLTGWHSSSFHPNFLTDPGEYELIPQIRNLSNIPSTISPPPRHPITVVPGVTPRIRVSGTVDGENPWPWSLSPTVALYRFPADGPRTHRIPGVDQPGGYYALYDGSLGEGVRMFPLEDIAADEPLAVVLYGRNGLDTAGHHHYTLLYRFFTLEEVPFDEGTHTYDVTLDATEFELVQSYISSENELGVPMDSHQFAMDQEVDYSITLFGPDDFLVPFHLGRYQEATWLPADTPYLVRGISNREGHYVMHEEFTLGGAGGDPVHVTLGGGDLQRLTVEALGQDPHSVYRLWGAALRAQQHDGLPLLSRPPDPFMPVAGEEPLPEEDAGALLGGQGDASMSQQDQMQIWVQPGHYDVDLILARYHVEGTLGSGPSQGWAYRLYREVDLSTSHQEIAVTDAWHASLDLEALVALPQEAITFLPEIQDANGNRLVAVGRVPWDGLAWDFYGQEHHYHIAPFITVFDGQDEEVLRFKVGDERFTDFRDLIERPYDFFLPALTTTTYFVGEVAGLPEGVYTAQVELGAGPRETLYSEPILFLVSSDLVVGLSGPTSPTNLSEAEISGITRPGAEVTVHYQVNGDPVSSLPPVVAGSRGRVTITLPLALEGLYHVTATVSLAGETGGELESLSLLVDRTAPSAPSHFMALGQDEHTILLTWDEATDDASGVAGYVLLRDGVLLVEMGPEARHYQDTGLITDQDYEYTLFAVDVAGNEGTPVTVLGNTSSEGDTEPPTAPENLTALVVGNQVTLRWDASTDNIGVAGYTVYRREAEGPWAEVGQVTEGLTYVDRGLEFDTTYYYRVEAYDASGNVSSPSEELEVIIGVMYLSEVNAHVGRNHQGFAIDHLLILEAYGSAGAVVTALVERSRWDGVQGPLDGDPVPDTMEVPLDEGPDGYYRATLTLPQDTVSLDAVTLFLLDSEGTVVAQESALEEPVLMAGTVQVDVTLDEAAYGDDQEAYEAAVDRIRGFRLEVFSPSVGQARSASLVDGPGTYEMQGMSPAEDYTVRLLDSRGLVLEQRVDVEILAAWVTTMAYEVPVAARLFVTVEDDGGNPLANQRLNVFAPTGGWVATAQADAEGIARRRATPSLIDHGVATEEYTLRDAGFPSQNTRAFYEPFDDVSVVLEPGDNHVVITVQRVPLLTLSGHVYDEETGMPLEGIKVEAYYLHHGYIATRTDADGYFIYEERFPSGVAVSLRLADGQIEYLTDWLHLSAEEVGQPQSIDLRAHHYVDFRFDLWVNMIGNDGAHYPLNDPRNGGVYLPGIPTLQPGELITAANADVRVKLVNGQDFAPADGVKLREFPYLRAYGIEPGDPVEVTVDARSHGFHRSTRSYTTSEGGGVNNVRVNLVEMSRIDVTLTDPGELDCSGHPRSAVLFDMDGSVPQYVGGWTAYEPNLSIHVDEGKTYALVLFWGVAHPGSFAGWEYQVFQYWEDNPDDNFVIVRDIQVGAQRQVITINETVPTEYRMFLNRFYNDVHITGYHSTPFGGMRMRLTATFSHMYDVLFQSMEYPPELSDVTVHVTLPHGVEHYPSSFERPGYEVSTDAEGRVVVSHSSPTFSHLFNMQSVDLMVVGATAPDPVAMLSLNAWIPEELHDDDLYLEIWAEYRLGGQPFVEFIRRDIELVTRHVHLQAPTDLDAAGLVFQEDLDEDHPGGGAVPITVGIPGNPFAEDIKVVNIYDGDRLVKSVPIHTQWANTFWYELWAMRLNVDLEVHLARRGLPFTHHLVAEVEYRFADGSTLSLWSPIRSVEVGQGPVQVLYIDMHHHNEDQSAHFRYVLGDSGLELKSSDRSFLDWNNLNIFSFEVGFSDNHLVEDVLILCESRGPNTTLQLEYDEGRDAFYGRGALGDFMNPPGDFSISWEMKPFGDDNPYPELGPDDIDASQFYWNMPPNMRHGTVTAAERDPDDEGGQYFDTFVSGELDIARVFGEDRTLTIPEVHLETVDGLEATVNIAYHYLEEDDEIPEADFSMYLGQGRYAYGFVEASEEETRVSIIAPYAFLLPAAVPEGFTGQFTPLPGDFDKFGMTRVDTVVEKVAGPLSGLLSMIGEDERYLRRAAEYASLRESALFSDQCGGAITNMMHNQLDVMEATSQASHQVRQGFNAAGMAAMNPLHGLTFGLADAVLDGWENAMFNATTDHLMALADLRAQEGECENVTDRISRIARSRRRFSRPRYKIDPSGFVFEGHHDNLVEGVSATVYYQDDGGLWHPWDSELYEEGPNPQFTDGEGRYGWDVFPGLWQVIYEKEGYRTAYSEELTVPPPHTDVDISLVSVEAPEVEGVRAGSGGSYVQVAFSRPMIIATVDATSLRVYWEGDEVPGEVSPVNPALSAAGNKQLAQMGDTEDGVPLARGFRFIPDEALTVGETYTVAVSKEVVAYNSRGLEGGDFETDVVIPEVATIPLEAMGFADHEWMDVAVGDTLALAGLLSLFPAEANDYDLSWESDSPEIATVSSGGVVSGLSPGHATIIVETASGLMAARGVQVYEEPRTEPILVDPDNNQIRWCRPQLTVGEPCLMWAIGDRQDQADLGQAVLGDERYVPLSWSINDAEGSGGSWSDPPYGVIYTATEPGTLTTTVVFQKKVYNGILWADSTTVVRTRDITVFAAEEPVPVYTLDVDRVGEGTVRVDGVAVVDLPFDQVYSQGDTVDLHATGASQWVFDKWVVDGVVHNTPRITITMTSDTNATAYFVTRPPAVTPPSPPSGEAEVTIEIEGVGSTDPEPGTYIHDAGTTLTVRARSGPRHIFGYWKINGQRVDVGRPPQTLEYLLEEDVTVTAVFVRPPAVFPYMGEVFGPEGGILEIPGLITITIPRGALAQETEVGVEVRAIDPDEIFPPRGPVDGLVFRITAHHWVDDVAVPLEWFEELVEVQLFYQEELEDQEAERILEHYGHVPLGMMIPIPTEVDIQAQKVTAEMDRPTDVVMGIRDTFMDTDGHWGERYIQFLSEVGPVDGFPDRTFRPNDLVTREQFAKMLVDAAGRSLQVARQIDVLFNDAGDISDWARSYAETAVLDRLVQGFDDDTFRPHAPVTRAQVATMISRALGLTPEGEPPFADAHEIPDWASGHVAALAGLDIVRGYPVAGAYDFRPDTVTTRTEAAAFLTRYLEERLRR